MPRNVRIIPIIPTLTRPAPLATLTADSVEDAAHAWAEARGSLALINHRSGLYAVSFSLVDGQQFMAEDVDRVL